MIKSKKFVLIIVSIFFLVISIFFYLRLSTPSEYSIVLVGDSMTERLGNSDEIKAQLEETYPHINFQIYNYGFGSTNILSVQDRLEKETFHLRSFQPILDINSDLIIIESFGHNPLSDFPLEEGLKKHAAALDKIVETIQKTNTHTKIIFLATLSPNTYKYAEGQVELSEEKRAEWAKERIRYIKNHISYAKSHNIPLINVYEKSLDSSSNGNIEYLSSDDFIHPSAQGIRFISKEIVDYLINNKII